MPFPMKIQPIDIISPEGSSTSRYEPVKPVNKSRFKRLFERQFSSVLKISAPEKITGTGAGGGESHFEKEICDELEPSSVCLNKMVENFIYYEGNDNKQRCGRQRCNCLGGNGTDTSDDEADSFNCFGESNHTTCPDACDSLKSLVLCASVSERNLLADITKIVEKNKIGKIKDDFCRKIVTDGLLALGYDASICKSRCEKTSSFPAGEYEYVDVLVDGDRLLIDIDFRSEFEIARSTKSYKSILQVLPTIFVGKADRLQRIVGIVSEAAKLSLKKKGMPFPPWRKAEYVKAKWLSPYTRTTPTSTPMPSAMDSHKRDVKIDKEEPFNEAEDSRGELEQIIGEKISPVETNDSTNDSGGDDEERSLVVAKQWKPPETKPKRSQIGVKILTGLASVIED